tara:strand:+ start:3195 stop:4700 length:1506 start_codon:yes stop_codon:yes gene_type:complete
MKNIHLLKSKRKIFIGGDFQKLQYIWLIHLIFSYCKQNQIHTIIFEYKKDVEMMFKYDSFLKLSKNFEIVFLDDLLPKWTRNKYLKIIYFLFSSINLSIKVRLIGNSLFNNPHNRNIFYGVWDFAYRNSNNLIYPSLLDILYSSYHFLQKLHKARFLIELKINSAFLGHSVYHSKAYINEFRKYNIEFFCNSWNLHLQNNNFDTLWDFPSKTFINKIIKNINNDQVNSYWSNRESGKGNYADSNYASLLKGTDNNKKIENIIFLHIFKDTPNHIVDENRIFTNYIEWIIATLKIISSSDEKWLIRLHPSYKKWGEDQYGIIRLLIKSISKSKNLQNIILDDMQRSNVSLLKNAKKIITYSGTVANEAVCYGIKPITISKTNIFELENNLVFKPKNYLEYKKLILDNDDKKFKLNKEDELKGKFLVYIRENVLNLIVELKYKYIFFNDKDLIEKKDIFHDYYLYIDKRKSYLYKIGSLLGSKISHSISEKYLNLIYNVNDNE